MRKDEYVSEILKDDSFGEQAAKLYEDANLMLDRIAKKNWLELKARSTSF